MKTVNLQLAKELKEKGFPQDTKFFWNRLTDCPDGTEDWDLVDFELTTAIDVSAAPTADEILDLLPAIIKDEEIERWLEVHVFKASDDGKYAEQWWVCYEGMGFDYVKNAETIADAAAKMWLYLKEHNYID